MAQTNNFVQKYVSSGGPLTDSLIFDNGTDVGIGTTSPSDTLTIDGGGVTIKSGNTLTLWRSDNVAAGTLKLNSSNQIEVNTEISMASHNIQNVATLRGSGPQLVSSSGSPVRLSNNPNNTSGSTAVVVDTDAAATITNLFAIRNNGTEKLTVDSYGRVGIGIPPNNATLTLNDYGGGGIPLLLDTTRSGPTVITENIIEFHHSFYGATHIWAIGMGAGSSPSAFEIYQGDDGIDALAVDYSTGYVGIGTISPSEILDVAGTTRTQNLNITTGGSTTISTGIGTVKMSTANNANSAAWIPIAYNGTTYYVPAWTTNAP